MNPPEGLVESRAVSLLASRLRTLLERPGMELFPLDMEPSVNLALVALVDSVVLQGLVDIADLVHTAVVVVAAIGVHGDVFP